MFVNLHLRWPGSGPEFFHEIDTVLAWPLASIPAKGGIVGIDGADFTVTDGPPRAGRPPDRHLHRLHQSRRGRDQARRHRPVADRTATVEPDLLP